jgi:hypothetical protein
VHEHAHIGIALMADKSAKAALEHRRWKKELSLAEKRERDWLSEANRIVKRYRGEEKKRNRYNVLWATTETLRPAIYNSKPNPDVRRRFRDADPLGKSVGEVLERCLFVLFDGDEPDSAIKNDLLDSLLGGRGVSRVRYVPKLAPDGSTLPTKKPLDNTDDEDGSEGGSEPGEPNEDTYEQVEDEQVAIEHVDWRDYREGYGRTWAEVPWTGFRHKLIRADAEEKFDKENLVGVEFAAPTANEKEKTEEQVGETQKVAEFWEIWDKLGEKVFFLQDNVEHLLFPKDNPKGEPPLEFEGFFCCPDPLAMVENTGSRLPIAPFTLYENQANELDKISVRIDRIVNVCRLRGIYDAKIPELGDLMSADDNELVPIQNAQQWAQGTKGLDGAISWMPVEALKDVLAALYDARDRQKAIIDELTGVSDIVRGATDPNETASAQQLKSSYHSIRLSRMQGEVTRYIKDLMRLASQVISGKFGQDTLAKMTDLKFPTAQDKQLMQSKMAMAQQTQQPPDPNLVIALQTPSWEDILGMLHSPALRQFRVDVETDSTIAQTLDSDMSSLSMLLKAISQVMTELAPLVEAGALPVDAAKEIVMAVIRRAKLGTAVEDAFDKMQAPKPKPNPEQVKAQAAQQQAQAKAQADAQSDQARAHADMQVAQMKQQGEQQIELLRQQFETSRIQFVEQQKTEREALEARFDAAIKIIVAQIAATKAADSQAGPTAESDFQRGVQ